MTKILLISFGTVSRTVFELGAIILSWLLWGWQVGVAFLLWYILWTWVSLYLIKYRKEIEDGEKKDGE